MPGTPYRQISFALQQLQHLNCGCYNTISHPIWLCLLCRFICYFSNPFLIILLFYVLCHLFLLHTICIMFGGVSDHLVLLLLINLIWFDLTATPPTGRCSIYRHRWPVMLTMAPVRPMRPVMYLVIPLPCAQKLNVVLKIYFTGLLKSYWRKCASNLAGSLTHKKFTVCIIRHFAHQSKADRYQTAIAQSPPLATDI